MKTLQESILDSEDTILDTMGQDIMNNEILKISEKINNGSNRRKKGCDMCGHKVNPGDAVIALIDREFISPGLVFNIDKSGTSCNIMFLESDLEVFQLQSRDYYDYSLSDVLKIDKDIMLKILK